MSLHSEPPFQADCRASLVWLLVVVAAQELGGDDHNASVKSLDDLEGRQPFLSTSWVKLPSALALVTCLLHGNLASAFLRKATPSRWCILVQCALNIDTPGGEETQRPGVRAAEREESIRRPRILNSQCKKSASHNHNSVFFKFIS